MRASMSDPSLYSRLGGEMAVMAAARLFYDKVMGDDRLSPFFAGVDMDAQIQKQIAFLTMAFGGPHQYSGRSLHTAHAPLVQRGLNDAHFDATVAHMAETLRELGVEDALIAEVGALVETTRSHVLGRAA
jgi:hemoglobin